MDFTKLIAGIVMIIVFTWLLIRNLKRTGFMHALFRIDTLLGLAAGIYLVFSAFFSQ